MSQVSSAESINEMSNKKVVIWGDVAYAARITFAETVIQEWEALEWTWQAWEILIESGLATYSTKIELYKVVVRFLALIGFYLEFCNEDWEYWFQDCLKLLAGYICINDFHIKEFNLYIDLFIPLQDKNNNNTQIDIDTIIFLVKNALNEVLDVLIKGFGSKSLMFKSLWQSTKPGVGEHEPEIDEYEKYYRECNFHRSEVELMEKTNLIEKIECLAATYESIYEEEEENKFYETESINSLTSTEIIHFNIEKATSNIQQFFEGEVINVEENTNESLKYVQFDPLIKPKYSLSKCSDKISFDEPEIEYWLRAISRKKQAIFQGSPGIGKTYIADKLAKHLISGTDGFLELLQFHPAYSYEDFIQGIRPQSQDGKLTYPLIPGRFLDFCKKAESRQGLCVLIIDEINRANLAQIFGELMYLLEYRNKKIRLSGSNELFSIPENVRIIATMNTADRSIALVDHALRRRFAFIELRPNYQVLKRYHEKHKTGFKVDGLIEILNKLNNAIANKHYEIGISFFLIENIGEQIEDIWKMEIEPYLEEYFFDQLEKADRFRWDKIKQNIVHE